jgi:hypothetical protein
MNMIILQAGPFLAALSVLISPKPFLSALLFSSKQYHLEAKTFHFNAPTSISPLRTISEHQ